MTNIVTEYVGPKASIEGSTYDWYNQPEESAYQGIFSVVNKINNEQSIRSSMNLRNARLYSSLELMGMGAYQGAASFATPNDITAVTYNVIKSCIDTAASKIAKNRPKPQFLTDGGDWLAQDKAKKLTKYVEGVFYNSRYYENSTKIFVDACVFGTGFMKFMEVNGQIKCERVIPEEIKVEDNDALYGNPKSLYQVKQISREVLLKLYPSKKFAILSASSSTPANAAADLIQVIEAWHLGVKHVIAIDGATLYSEDWNFDFFPFVTFRWSDRLTGYFGQGLSEELTGMQIEINRILRSIQMAHRLVALPRVFMETSANVSSSQVNNEIGSIVKYSGGTRPPVFQTPTGMNPEVYQHLQWLITSSYEKTGISQMSATSKKPAGLDSGEALREYNDVETERFLLTAMRFEQLALDAAKIIITMSKKMFEKNKKLSVKVPGKGFIETIQWKEVNLDDESYIMKCFPVGLLPSQPAGRMQKVQEMIAAGWVDKTQALELLDFPDLEQFQQLEVSNANLVEKTIAKMIDTGEYYPPEPQMDLVRAAQTAHKYYLKGRVDNLPEDKTELLLRFIDDAERLNKANQIAEQPPAPAPVPQAVPEPLPQSDLLPQVQPQ